MLQKMLTWGAPREIAEALQEVRTMDRARGARDKPGTTNRWG